MNDPKSQVTTPSQLRRRPPPMDDNSIPTNTSPSHYSNQSIQIEVDRFTTPYTTPSRNTVTDNDNSYFEMSGYVESPRPSGPRELTDYDINHIESHTETNPTTYNDDYFLNRRRSYQQMSRSPTYPTQRNDSVNRSPMAISTPSTPKLYIDTANLLPATKSVVGSSPSPYRDSSMYSRSASPSKSSSPTHFHPPDQEMIADSPSSVYSDDNVEMEIEYVNRQIEALHNYTQYISGRDVLPSLPPFRIEKDDSMYPVSVTQTPSTEELDQKLKSGELPPVPIIFSHRSDYQANLWRESHFKECESIDSMTSIYKWCLKLREWSSGSDMSAMSFKMSIFKLIASKLSLEFHYNVQCTDQIIESLVSYNCIQYVTYEEPQSHIRILDDGIIPDRNDFILYREDEMRPDDDANETKGQIDENLNVTEFVKGHWEATLPSSHNAINVIAEILGSEILFRTNATLYIKALAPELGSLVRKEYQDVKFENNLIRWATQIVEVHEKYLLRPLLEIWVSDTEPQSILIAINKILDIYFIWSEHVRKPLKEHYLHLIGRLYYLSKFKNQLDSLPKIKGSSQNSEMLVNSVFSRFSKINLQFEKFKIEGIDIGALKIAMRWIDDLGFEVNSKIERGGNAFQLGRIQKLLTWSSVKKLEIDWNSKVRRFISEGQAELKWNFVMRKVTIIVLDNYVFITEKSDKKNEAQVLLYIPTKFLLIEKKQNTDPVQFKLRYCGIKSYTFTAGDNFPFQSLTIPKSLFFERTNATLPYALNVISNAYFAYDLHTELENLQVYSELDPIYECSIRDIPKATLSKYKQGSLPGELSISQIKCSSSFEYNNEKYIMLGSDLGLYCCDLSTHRWKLIMEGESINKIRTLEQKNLVFFSSKKRLRYFTLVKLIAMYEGNMKMSSCSLLSDGEVDFFEVGQHEKEQMIIYGKKEGAKTYLRTKVPVTDHGGIVNSFNNKDPFYDPGECNGIAIFKEFVAIYSNKNFTIMNLNHLRAKSVIEEVKGYIEGSNLNDSRIKAGLDSIYSALSSSDAKPMGMFRLRNSKKNEYILAYRKFAIFVNNDLKLTRSSKFSYPFVAESVTFKNDHLILVAKDVIEIWAIRENGRPVSKLVQVLAGKDVRMLNSTSLVFSMTNPVLPKFRLVFQLSLAST